MFSPKHDKDIMGLLKEGAKHAKGSARRMYMAKVVQAFGHGGQRLAERELGWNRKTIRKGQYELEHGVQQDKFAARGRKKVEAYLPNLLQDIRDIASQNSETDPTFHTTKLYTPLSAKSVRQQLVTVKHYRGYRARKLPGVRTLNTKLNEQGFRLTKIGKHRPLKKIAKTNAIFEQMHQVNAEADSTPGVTRISLDTKAKINIGPFARGGKSRQGLAATDHDFQPESTLFVFGLSLPAGRDVFLDFTASKVTADFMADSIERLWPELQRRFGAHMLVLNADNGPESNSHRTQFIKRMVDFAYRANIVIRLAYYPPYHSKYNPVERVWGVLEQHWNRELLDSVPKTLALARSMTWRGKHPEVHLIEGEFATGIKLTQREMQAYEAKLQRRPGLERWFVDIVPTGALNLLTPLCPAPVP